MPKIGYKQTEEHRLKIVEAATGVFPSQATRRRLSIARMKRSKKQICKHGHDTFVSGRSRAGGCRSCTSNGKWKKSGIINADGSLFSTTDFDNAYRIQRGICAICGSNKSLRVDHSHSSGVFRGLLCNVCNKTLGHYEKIKSSAEIYLGNTGASL